MTRLCILLIISLLTLPVFSQSVSINTDGSTADPSAILDVRSTTKGVLVPRMTKAERDAISTPAAGLMVYQTDNTPGLYMYSGTSWSSLTMVTQVWGISGNNGTNPATDFLGTADNNPLRFRLNNKWAGELNHSSGNACLGDSAGIMMSSGFSNTSFGNKSLKKNSTGKQNVSFGYKSLMNNTTGDLNTAVGHNSLQNNMTGFENTALGSGTLSVNNGGYYNTAMGAAALYFNNNNGNTAVGAYSLYANTAHENTAVGMRSLQINSYGFANTAVGAYSLYQNTGGYYCTSVGHSALYTSSTGDYNTALGANALHNNEYGASNTAVGANALYSNNVGYDNTAVGEKSLYNATTSIYNSALGYKAAYYTTTGGSNVAVGFWSLYNNTTGSQNVGIGNEALAYNYTGTYNVAVGSFSGTSTTFNNTVSLGNHGYLNGGNNQSFLGNLSTIWNGGNVGWSTYSDARVKTDIEEDVKGLDFITRLRPVTYHRDIDIQAQLTGNVPVERTENSHDIEQIKFSGFLAQEVAQAAQSSGYEFSGITFPGNDHELYTLRYETFVVPLVKAVQEQQAIIDELKSKLAAVEKYIEEHRK